MSTTANLTLEQYEQLAEAGTFDGLHRPRIEFIHGEIRAMNPIGSFHSQVLSDLTDWSYDVVPRREIAIRVQTTLRMPSQNSSPEPDLVWVRRRSYARHHPEPADVHLLIEVAESSLAEDRGEKLELYATAGIPEYWIANLVDFTVEVHREPSGHSYANVRTFGAGESVSPVVVPTVRLAVDYIFPQIS